MLRKWRRIEEPDIPANYDPKERITVLIPARNEEANIEVCVQSILNGNFPKLFYRIIVVDDQSNDDTTEIVKSIKSDRIKLIKLDPNQVGGKKVAIKAGIDEADTERIVQIDADVVVGPNWLKGISFYFDWKSARFLTGPVVFSGAKNPIELFQSLEITGLMVMTGAGIHSQKYFLANGANMAYLKSEYLLAFDELAAIDRASGDDVFLIQHLHQKDPNGIYFMKSKEVIVSTQAEKTLTTFFHQRIRWAGKTSDYKSHHLRSILNLIFLFCFTALLNLVLACFVNPMFWWVLGFQISVKMAADYFYLFNSTRYFKQRNLMRYFITSSLIHIAYMISIGMASLFVKNYNWKDRRVR